MKVLYIIVSSLWSKYRAYNSIYYASSHNSLRVLEIYILIKSTVMFSFVLVFIEISEIAMQMKLL